MGIQPYVVAITGGSGSGKSTFVRELKARFSEDELSVLTTDNYYHPLEKVPVDRNGVQNFDTPESIDHTLLIEHMNQLVAGNSFQKLEYTFNKPGWIPEMLTFTPTPIIVLEGIFSLHFKELNELADFKIYIDADAQARCDRRTARDSVERGLEMDDVLYRWKNHILPVFDRNHNEYKRSANVIIMNNSDFNHSLDMVAAFLRHKLNSISAGKHHISIPPMVAER